ncbi:MAG TPA: response regulator transcription factor [Solirubrobacteraceae bacterium]|nr:response regulator transcription factor [Solirubrobacteraceae bacterium]
MRVVIGEDEALLREGLVHLLEKAGIEVLGVAEDAPGLIELARAREPELVITDIRMPPGHTDDGLRAALEIRAQRPSTPIVILSQYVHRSYAVELLADDSAGVGYLLKQRVANGEVFCRDLRRVAHGGTVLDPEVVTVMLARARRDRDAIEQLTPRQAEVLALLAEGRSNAAIARRLVISEKAVVQHVSRIYDQLGLAPSEDDHRRVLAVARYLAR